MTAPLSPLVGDSRRRVRLESWAFPAALLFAILAAYSNVFHSPFLFDDQTAVVNNPTIRRLASIAVLDPPADGGTTTGRPLVNISLALDHAMGGEDVVFYHTTNLVIHALAALVLMGLVHRLLQRPIFPVQTRLLAWTAGFAAALLWALHPLACESVVCIAQRTESLCALCYLFTLYAFVRASANDSSFDLGWAGVSVFACLCGMASKEVMVTAPLAVLLCDRTFFSATFSGAWKTRRGYYLALGLTWSLLGALVFAGHGTRGTAAGFGLGVSPVAYFLTQTRAVVIYLGRAAWPHPLLLDYGTKLASPADAAGPLAAVGLLLAATIWALRRRPVIGCMAAMFFLILAPSSSFVPLLTQTIAEHRMYLPLALLVAFAVPWILVHGGSKAMGPLVFLGLGLGIATHARVADYRDAVSIWSDTVVKAPENARAHNNLAWALSRRGDSVGANAEYARAVALAPDYVSPRFNWGAALLREGRVNDALMQLEIAVRLAPEHPDAQLDFGNALLRAGRPTEAIPHFERAIELRPEADAHYNLGVALMDSHASAAVEHFQAALQLDPTLARAHYQLARLAERDGHTSEAEKHYRDTVRLAPDDSMAHAALGLIFAQTDRLPAAADQLRTAVALDPHNVPALANLGNVLLLLGQPRDAIPYYETVLRLQPADARARDNLQLAREAAERH